MLMATSSGTPDGQLLFSGDQQQCDSRRVISDSSACNPADLVVNDVNKINRGRQGDVLMSGEDEHFPGYCRGGVNGGNHNKMMNEGGVNGDDEAFVVYVDTLPPDKQIEHNSCCVNDYDDVPFFDDDYEADSDVEVIGPSPTRLNLPNNATDSTLIESTAAVASGDDDHEASSAGEDRDEADGDEMCDDNDDNEEEGEEEEEDEEVISNAESVELPFPGFPEVSLKYFYQNTRPRNWCLVMLTNPYPFPHKQSLIAILLITVPFFF